MRLGAEPEDAVGGIQAMAGARYPCNRGFSVSAVQEW